MPTAETLIAPAGTPETHLSNITPSSHEAIKNAPKATINAVIDQMEAGLNNAKVSHSVGKTAVKSSQLKSDDDFWSIIGANYLPENPAEANEAPELDAVDQLVEDGILPLSLASAVRMYELTEGYPPSMQMDYRPWWSDLTIGEMLAAGDVPTVRSIYGLGS